MQQVQDKVNFKIETIDDDELRKRFEKEHQKKIVKASHFGSRQHPEKHRNRNSSKKKTKRPGFCSRIRG